MWQVGVVGGVDGDRLEVEIGGGPEDAQRDLAAVRYQQTGGEQTHDRQRRWRSSARIW